MRYVAAYLLAVLGGNASPKAADIEKILSSVGIEADGERVKKIINELNGKSIDELIAQGERLDIFTANVIKCISMMNLHITPSFA